jgi:hypothetical protein
MRWSWLAFLLVACSYSPASLSGDDDSDANTGSDGNGGDGMPVDAAVIPCGYTELQDTTNNGSAGAEMTNLTFASPTVLCGDIDEDHFDSINSRVDIDSFRVSAASTATVLIHLTAPGAEELDVVAIQVLNSTGTSILKVGRFVGDHGTAQLSLPAGDSIIGVVAQNSSAIAAPIPYRLKIVGDDPSARCTQGSAVATYNESGDGGNDTDNDMVQFFNGSNQKFLTSTGGDSAESVSTGVGALELDGTSAPVNAQGDSYFDRDTYEIVTGATTNQLSVRLNWAATTIDFDFLVLFPNTPVSFGAGLTGSFTQDEFDTIAVEPNTKYWVWVGADDVSTGLPASYQATVCGVQFSP